MVLRTARSGAVFCNETKKILAKRIHTDRLRVFTPRPTRNPFAASGSGKENRPGGMASGRWWGGFGCSGSANAHALVNHGYDPFIDGQQFPAVEAGDVVAQGEHIGQLLRVRLLAAQQA